jgi:uncharacterized protein YlxW (UPF0749 family)
MAKIQIEESALDSMQAMAQKLKDERDALYRALVSVSTCEDVQTQRAAMDDAILLALSMEPA